MSIVMKIECNVFYQLRNSPLLGDWQNSIILVEAGPRGTKNTVQYRASFGKGSADVDWIDLHMFEGAIRLGSTAVLKEDKSNDTNRTLA